jgi:hypothetical protein
MKNVSALLASVSLALAFQIGGAGLGTSIAKADSCWYHNGTLMRLQASGNQRWFVYEDPRKSWMRPAGIGPGTLLFDGQKNGNRYSGTARRFSKHCPGSPLEYYVEGPVSANQTKVTLRGRYEVHSRCNGTGEYKNDTLVFTYSHQC